MAKRCLTCKQWEPRLSGDIARLGFARCKLGEPWVFYSLNFSCDRYGRGEKEVNESRAKWAKRFDRTVKETK